MEEIYSRKLPVEEMDNSSVLITGATGMLASYFVFFLIWLNEYENKNIHIMALVRDKQKARVRFGQYMDMEYFTVIVSSLEMPLEITGKVDYIVHAASLASPQYYVPMPIEVAIPNAIGTYYVLRLAEEKHCKSVLYFSTGDIYGAVSPDSGVIDEKEMGRMDPLDPHSCYGESKRMGETWCASFAREHSVPVKIARIWHTYAPTMEIENDPRVFASFMKCVAAGEDIVMHSDGSSKRSFCYITDAIVGYILILLKGKVGEAYNVCNPEAFVSMRELAEILTTLSPLKRLKVVCTERAQGDVYLENRANRQNCPSAGKMKQLGWSCRYSVKSGFERVLQYLNGC